MHDEEILVNYCRASIACLFHATTPAEFGSAYLCTVAEFESRHVCEAIFSSLIYLILQAEMADFQPSILHTAEGVRIYSAFNTGLRLQSMIVRLSSESWLTP